MPESKVMLVTVRQFVAFCGKCGTKELDLDEAHIRRWAASHEARDCQLKPTEQELSQ